MHTAICALAAWALFWPATSLLAQTTQQELLQKLATVKESVARNQAELREFSWTERTVTSVKGEIRRTEVANCRYLQNDKLQRTVVSESEQVLSGLKARIFEMKTATVEAHSRRLLALLHTYLPPSARQMSAAHQAGNASLGAAAPGEIALDFKNFYYPGDWLAFTFDSATRSLRKIFVNTYLDEAKDPVTVVAVFESLPDGPNHLSSTILNEKAKGIQIAIQTSNYQKLEE